MPGLDHVVDVKCGGHHALALDKHGALHAWGDDASGQLGVSAERLGPRGGLARVRFPRSGGRVVVEKIAAGWRSSACVDQHGRAWAWGEAPRSLPCLEEAARFDKERGPELRDTHRGRTNAPGLVCLAFSKEGAHVEHGTDPLPPARDVSACFSKTLSVVAVDLLRGRSRAPRRGDDDHLASYADLARARSARLAEMERPPAAATPSVDRGSPRGGSPESERSARARSRKSTHHTHFHHVALDHATRAVAAGAEARAQERLRSVAKRYPAAAPLGALPSASETVRLLRYGL